MKKKESVGSIVKKSIAEEGIKSVNLYAFSLSLLFIISVTYYYFYGKGIFFFQESNSLFVFSSDYFLKFADKPGGILIWAGNFLTQFYYYPFYGALIISILLLLVFIVFRKIASVLNAGRAFSSIIIMLPTALLMLLQTRYDFHVQHILGFLIVSGWFLISELSPKGFIRIILIVLFPLLYYIAGSFTVIYLGLFIVYNVFYRQGNLRFLYPALMIAIAASTFLVFKDVLFLQPVDRLLYYPLFLNDTSRTTIFLSVLSGFIILIPVFTWSAKTIALNTKLGKLAPLIIMVTILALSVFIMIRSYDREADNVMRFEKMVYDRDWDGVIKMHEKLQSSNIVEQYYYNLALSERGQLCSRMFFGRQSYGSMSLTLTRDNEQSYRAMFFYYAIGLSGEAHHLAYELMVQHGYRPETLKMLIKTELINGNFKVAERYINILKKTIYYRKWVGKYEKMLFKTEAVNSDPELGEKIRLLPGQDFFVVTDDFGNLERLLQVNPESRIAFEYKMAKLLLEKDLMEVGSEVKKLKGLGYNHLPRHIEEAVVSLVNVTKEFPDLGGLKITADTDQRFLRYFSDLNSFKGNMKMVDQKINKTDKNTFWYYLQFGLVKSNFFKSGPVDYSIY